MTRSYVVKYETPSDVGTEPEVGAFVINAESDATQGQVFEIARKAASEFGKPMRITQIVYREGDSTVVVWPTVEEPR